MGWGIGNIITYLFGKDKKKPIGPIIPSSRIEITSLTPEFETGSAHIIVPHRAKKTWFGYGKKLKYDKISSEELKTFFIGDEHYEGRCRRTRESKLADYPHKEKESEITAIINEHYYGIQIQHDKLVDMKWYWEGEGERGYPSTIHIQKRPPTEGIYLRYLMDIPIHYPEEGEPETALVYNPNDKGINVLTRRLINESLLWSVERNKEQKKTEERYVIDITIPSEYSSATLTKQDQ